MTVAEHADYAAFGAFFGTATKEVRHHAEPDLLAWWSDRGGPGIASAHYRR